jgi:hypothetical protein
MAVARFPAGGATADWRVLTEETAFLPEIRFFFERKWIT